MASIIVSLEGQAVRRSGGKPKLVIRGERRALAMKLKKKLEQVVRADEAESRRGVKYKYNPALLLGNHNSRFRNAAATLIERLEEMLAQKV